MIRFWVFAVFALAFFLSYLYRTVNAVLAPELVERMGATTADLGLLTSAYFLSFALCQVPVGMLLDRIGPRRVQMVLLPLAGLGGIWTAYADSIPEVALARVLIGAGVSASLMAALNAMLLWFRKDQLPAVNGWVLAVGGLGAVAAGRPVEWFVEEASWFGLFFSLGTASIILAILFAVSVPDRRATTVPLPASELWPGLRAAVCDPFFLRIAPLVVVSQGVYMAYQGLWAAQWLTDVEGLGQESVAVHVSLLCLAMVGGYVVLGSIASRLGKAGIPTVYIAVWVMAAFILVQFPVLLRLPVPSLLLWFAYGLIGSGSVLAYAAIAQHYPSHLAGRASTAINLFIFTAAFAIQAGVGVALEALAQTASALTLAERHQAILAAAIVAQALGLAWYAGSYRWKGNSLGVAAVPGDSSGRRAGPLSG